MAQFNDYTTASSIDPINDQLLIYNFSTGTLENINRNTLLALSSVPLGLTDTQSPTNKTFNNTNSFTIKDGSFTLQNSANTTKQATFSLAALSLASNRTITIPDASGTLGLLGSTQTWTGVNSFTGSSWTGGTISNTSIAADTITGYTTSNSGSIYGVAITSGAITGANTIGPNALQTNAVQGNQLATTAITLGYVQITTNFTTTSTTVVPVTGLSVTVTIPDGGRRVKITFFSSTATNNSNANGAVFSIWDGAVGSGTQVGQANQIPSSSGAPNQFCYCVAVVTPPAGSKTYNVGATVQISGTIIIGAATTSPAFILVEAI